MNCPKCGDKTAVKDSRKGPGASWRRRRGCSSCGFRFTTREVSGLLIDNLIEENQALRKKAEVYEKAFAGS